MSDTTCGHGPVYALGLCHRCYQADYKRKARAAENKDEVNRRRRERHQIIKEKNNAYQRAYYAANREKLKGRVSVEGRRNRLKSRYGMTVSDWESLFAAQGECCAICKTETPVGGWVVDHCHETEMVRGILCRCCNTAIGQLNDDPALVQSALNYLTTAQESLRRIDQREAS